MVGSAAREARVVVPLLAGAGTLWLAACFSGAGIGLPPDDEAGAGSISLGGDSGLQRVDADLGDPFSLAGLTPSHGPFTGGTRARIDGRGFSSKLRVFVGTTEIAPGALLASDPTRAAIVTPPGAPGFADVRIRDEATAKERVLPNGFYYDAIVAQPDSGATSGGTRIAITGSGTQFGAGTTVAIDGVACRETVVRSPTKIECVTPVGTPGSKDIVVETPGSTPIQAREAFTYSDSADGYRGGLSGGALSGRVKVLVYDELAGKPLAGAFAIVGSDLATAKIARTADNGVIEIGDLTGDKITVTVGAKCHQPMTFVDVPVDTVTAYISPVFDIACIEGDPPSFPSRSRYGGVVEGELVFPAGSSEFERPGWTTVPAPRRPTERMAAYVFEASPSPAGTFQLPAPSAAITPDSDGTVGYRYSLLVNPGNATLYVVAGLEDRSESPPEFVPYAMGVARGIPVPAQTRVTGVDVRVDVLFDHRVTVTAETPSPGPRGPDRFTASIATTLGAAGYAILPLATRTTMLPSPGTIPFVGVPALDHAMAGEEYVLGGVAATGPSLGIPASIVSRVRTTNANTPVSLGGFLGVPVLVEPGAGVWGGRHVKFTGAAGPLDLAVVEIVSGSGLVTWTIVAPPGKTEFDVPDLGAGVSPDPIGVRHGAISTTVYVARVEGFDYGRLRYGHLTTGSWTAYAYDNLGGVY